MTTYIFTQEEIEYLYDSIEADREHEEYQAFLAWLFSPATIEFFEQRYGQLA
jgi:uncharacterized protein YerC